MPLASLVGLCAIHDDRRNSPRHSLSLSVPVLVPDSETAGYPSKPLPLEVSIKANGLAPLVVVFAAGNRHRFRRCVRAIRLPFSPMQFTPPSPNRCRHHQSLLIINVVQMERIRAGPHLFCAHIPDADQGILRLSDAGLNKEPDKSITHRP